MSAPKTREYIYIYTKNIIHVLNTQMTVYIYASRNEINLIF